MSSRLSFAALRNRGYRAHFSTYVLAMMADNIEHVTVLGGSRRACRPV
jgi:hypothetical protein